MNSAIGCELRQDEFAIKMFQVVGDRANEGRGQGRGRRKRHENRKRCRSRDTNQRKRKERADDRRKGDNSNHTSFRHRRSEDDCSGKLENRRDKEKMAAYPPDGQWKRRHLGGVRWHDEDNAGRLGDNDDNDDGNKGDSDDNDDEDVTGSRGSGVGVCPQSLLSVMEHVQQWQKQCEQRPLVCVMSK